MRGACRPGAVWTVAGSVAVVLVSSCAGARPGRLEAADGRWQTMTRDKRYAYMKEVVTPQMSALFREFSPHAYARMDCTTCHGQRARTGHYEMPNPDLLLSEADAKSAWRETADAMDVFMARKVDPAMARLLGQRPCDPTTETGCGCFGCHWHEK